MSGNSLKINQDKTEFIIIKFDQYNHFSLIVGNEIIHPSKSFKILGVKLDFNMNMQQDVVNTCRSSYMHIRKVKNIRKYLSKESTLTLVNATVLMRLDYCNSIYTSLPQNTLHKLQQPCRQVQQGQHGYALLKHKTGRRARWAGKLKVPISIYLCQSLLGYL